MKIGKKIICFFLVCLLTVPLTTGTFALETDPQKQPIEHDKARKIADMLSCMCNDLADVCYLCERLNSYMITENGLEMTEYSLYPVISNGEVVALAQIARNEAGEEIISCITSFAKGLQRYYETYPNKSFAIIFADDGIYIAHEDGFLKILDTDYYGLKSILTLFQNQLMPDISYCRIKLDIPFYPNSDSSRALQYLTLNIGYVSNDPVGCTNSEQTGCDDIGLCWAASMAMIVNYYCGTSYTTTTIHTLTGCLSYSSNAYSFKSALQNRGLYVYGPYSSFTYNTIVGLTQGNRLAFMRGKRSYYNQFGQEKEMGHIVVPYGYYYDPDNNTNKYFYYKDPNVGPAISSFPSSGSLSFYSGGYYYTFDYYLDCSY